MDEKQKHRVWSQLAREIALHCVRNTKLEDWHAGHFPETRTGDYSDVKVIDGEGNVIPWNDLSRLSDPEMKIFMKEVVNKIYTYGMLGDSGNLRAYFDDCSGIFRKWDKPELDQSFIVGNEKPYAPISYPHEPK